MKRFHLYTATGQSVSLCMVVMWAIVLGFVAPGCDIRRCGDGTVAEGEACDDGNPFSFDGCEPDCTLSPDEIICTDLDPLESDTCAVTEGDGNVLITGTVLAPHTVLRGGQVLVDDSGTIACVGCDCAAQAPDATAVLCPRGVISPGLINTHDHLTFAQNNPFVDSGERYEHRHDWRKGLNGHTTITAFGGAERDQISYGELRFLMGGATSTAGAGGAPGFLRNLEYWRQDRPGQKPVELDTFPLGDADGTQLDTGCDYPSITPGLSIAREDAYLFHVAEGINGFAANECVCTASRAGGGQDLFEPQSAIIHGIALTPFDYAEMKTEGSGLIWSPRSNISLYGDTATVTVAHRLGVPIALGTDWIVSGSMNMLRELRCADSFNQVCLDRYFTDRDLWRMVTINAAVVTATDDVIGLIVPGHVADIAVFDGSHKADYRAIIAAAPEGVVMVLRGGKILFGDADIVDRIANNGICDRIDVCGRPKKVCSASETGMTLARLQSAVGDIYPAFFCGDPADEPTCLPMRSESVEGSSLYFGPTAVDRDGDGVNDAADNCPSVFNPVRPMDNGAQSDYDQDGTGDVCDECPLGSSAQCL